ncbi:hypothetical protein [Nocardia sp. NPDC049707]|uniref:hypothetical protein n=1 Tax=Nocardia sp. NPDC049707 TaxID=3154735 RepID=UPI00343072A8
MEQPNSSRASTSPGTAPERPIPGRAAELADLRARLGPLRSYWGYILAAVGSTATLILLFQSWITAQGPDGKVAANAFGRLDATTNYLNVWSQAKPKTPTVTGTWAILASAAIIIALCAIVLNIRLRSEFLARLTTISLACSALFVILCLIYLNSKGTELKAMTGRSSDLGGYVGQVLNWATGRGKFVLPGTATSSYSSAALTHSGFLAVVTSLGSTMAAIAQWLFMRRATDNPVRLSLRMPITFSRASSNPDTTT